VVRILTTASAHGVPVLLPYDYYYHKDEPNFKILVQKKEEVAELRNWILGLEPYRGSSKWLKTYFERLPNVRIISFKEVREHLDIGEENWSRIETILPPP